LNVGDLITADAVRSVRPGYGLAPKYLTDVIGQRVTTQVVKNSPVHRSVLANG
jgi:N-acetylneuraminate synthase